MLEGISLGETVHPRPDVAPSSPLSVTELSCHYEWTLSDFEVDFMYLEFSGLSVIAD